MYAIVVKFWVKTKKKGYRCSPTFVNLKSNTMKNTHAKVRRFLKPANDSTIKKPLCNVI